MIRVLIALLILTLATPAFASDFILRDRTGAMVTSPILHFEPRYQSAIVLGVDVGLARRFPNIRGQVENVTESNAGARYTAVHFADTDRPVFQLARARGNYDVPQSVQPGDVLGDIIWDGYQDDIDLFIGSARIRVVATDHGARTGLPGEFQFQISTTTSAFPTVARLRGWQATRTNETNLDLAVRTGTSASVKHIEVGSPNSCGTGYRCLRVRN
jgi:hypothetical protein